MEVHKNEPYTFNTPEVRLFKDGIQGFAVRTNIADRNTHKHTKPR